MLAPTFTKFPGNTYVEEGKKVLFEVEVTGTPQPKLTWYHNGEEVTTDYSRVLAKDGTFTLPSAEKKHAGVYKLVASNSVGRKESEVELAVKTGSYLEPPMICQKQTAVPVIVFGNHVEMNHKQNNQAFTNEFNVW